MTAKGFCKLTATIQAWLDREPAVISWTSLGRDFANFEYNDETEITDQVPAGILFADDDWDDARVEGVAQAIEIAISELDNVTDAERAALMSHFHSDGWPGYEDEIVDARTAGQVARQRMEWYRNEVAERGDGSRD